MEPKITGKRTHCYSCGVALIAGVNRTVDHVPPKGLFSKPRPNNLLTVPACLSCNNSKSDDDEFFRLLATMGVNRTPEAERVYEQRTLPNKIRKGRLRERIGALMTTVTDVSEEMGGKAEVMPGVLLPRGFVERMMKGFAQGVVAYANPSLLTHRLVMQARHFPRLAQLQEYLYMLAPRFEFVRGAGVFHAFYDMCPAPDNEGACLISINQMYHGLVFFHYPPPQPADYNNSLITKTLV